MPRRLLIDLPKEEERAQILTALLRGEQLDGGVDVGGLAALTPGYSGSDLKNLCIKAAFMPVRALLDAEQQQAMALQEQQQQGAHQQQGAQQQGARQPQRAQWAQPQQAAELRPILMEDFVAAQQTLRVSTALDTPTRESMMRWHDRFGEGGANRPPSKVGF